MIKLRIVRPAVLERTRRSCYRNAPGATNFFTIGDEAMTTRKTWALWRDGETVEEEARLLRRRAAELPVPFDAQAKKDVATMIDAFMKRDDALGLAAPQIGISKKIVIFKNKNFDVKGAP